MHGHELLLNYIRKTDRDTNTIIEIGATREKEHTLQNSTIHLCIYCNDKSIDFISVDMDSENILRNNNDLDSMNLKYKSFIKKGEDFLKEYDGVIDVIYLDAFDFYHNSHSEKRKSKYRDIMGTEITNENSHKMHLECSIEISKKSKQGTIVCFDDVLNGKTFDGKGKTAIPYLLDNGFEIIEYVPNAIILKKS